ncbi:hypothetical protein BCF44_109340 [Kutzneria buriramensis]|uniref:WD40 repeat protein n=1 Tax=Kutzneria buriramensis TaxID=1045776 RepID=A0A3E0HF08_9PSEU|nr:hypothetical protein BCF44_109340 [Kutzneria buriramensis]
MPVRASRTLPGEGYHTRPWAGGFVAVDRDGHATVLDGELGIVDELDVGPTNDLSRDGATWAWHADGALSVGDPRGEHASTPLPDIDHCAWSGDTLWVVHRSPAEFTVELRDRGNRMLRSTSFPDPLEGASALLEPHPSDHRMVLWFADGGVSDPVSWLFDDDLTRVELPTEYEAGPPVFGGDWFVYGNEEALVKVAWPHGEELRRLAWRAIEPDEDVDDSLDLDVLLLPDHHVLWHTSNGLTHVVDLGDMSWRSVAVDGHPAGPTSDFFPSLAGDSTPYTDFGSAVRGPHGLLATYGRRELVLTDPLDWIR